MRSDVSRSSTPVSARATPTPTSDRQPVSQASNLALFKKHVYETLNSPEWTTFLVMYCIVLLYCTYVLLVRINTPDKYLDSSIDNTSLSGWERVIFFGYLIMALYASITVVSNPFLIALWFIETTLYANSSLPLLYGIFDFPNVCSCFWFIYSVQRPRRWIQYTQNKVSRFIVLVLFFGAIFLAGIIQGIMSEWE